MQKIVPFLWFEDNAEEAMNFYLSVFHDSQKLHEMHYSDDVPGPKGKVMSATLRINGQEFMLLNGGAQPEFVFSPAISFVVNCESQAEVDELWEKLAGDGGRERQCGWLTDKFGITWQIVPTLLGRLMSDPNPAKAKAVTRAMLKMIKLDAAALQKAYDEA